MDAAKAFVLDAQGQEDLLKEALRNAQDQAFRMKRSMDTGELNGVLKHAAELLRELRTSLLSPKNYYQLYMQVLDELRHLENYVEELHKSGTSIRSLYERVQSSGNVLPRLYLLVTVGSVYIKSKEAPAREVLTDLVEMTKGVQYPLRGLFLRNYLSICVKDKLPDVGSAYEGDGGCVDDAIAFLLQNLSETNRLWIRMQTQKTGSALKDKSAREKERQDLRILVGTSLVRLSHMDGITQTVYAAQVLPQVLAIIVSCNDRIAQEYLMDCVIQVFPDEYHLQNLDQLLETMTKLQDTVNVAAIISALLERLTAYHVSMGTATPGGATTSATQQIYGSDADAASSRQQQLFALVMDAVARLAAPGDVEKSAAAQSLASMMTLYASFTAFTLACFPTQTAFVARVLMSCLSYVTAQSWRDDPANAAVVVASIETLVVETMERLSVPDVMRLDALPDLLTCLPWKTERKRAVLAFAHALLARAAPLETVAQVEFVTDVLAPLIRDDPADAPLSLEPTGADRDAFEREQATLSKVLHLVRARDVAVTFAMFAVVRRAIGHGGVFRIRFTLVPLIFQSLALARAAASSSASTTQPRDVLQFVHEMVTALASKLEQMSVTCVNLFLQCALVADRCGLEAIAYEFITQAFIVYEDQISHSREQWRALELLVGALRATRALSSANYEVVATKTTQHAAKLLKKHEQAAMVLQCAHLFWHPCLEDGKRVLECLQRSLRITDACSGTSATQVPLFIEILEAYVFFFDAKTPEVTQHYVSGLLALVKDHLENMEHGATRSECELRYRDILRYMDARALAAGALSAPAS